MSQVQSIEEIRRTLSQLDNDYEQSLYTINQIYAVLDNIQEDMSGVTEQLHEIEKIHQLYTKITSFPQIDDKDKEQFQQNSMEKQKLWENNKERWRNLHKPAEKIISEDMNSINKLFAKLLDKEPTIPSQNIGTEDAIIMPTVTYKIPDGKFN